MGYVYFSKRINYEIYKYLPNFKRKESEIIKKKDSTKKRFEISLEDINMLK
jgi:hypothetical protein